MEESPPSRLTPDREATEPRESEEMGKKMLRIRQIRSVVGRPRKQREVLRGLGLRRIRHEVERFDTPAVRGMLAKIPHLVEVVEETS